MNKTKKRAIEKHRAKARKFEAHRKEAGPSAALAAPRAVGAYSNARQRANAQPTSEPNLTATTSAGGEEG